MCGSLGEKFNVIFLKWCFRSERFMGRQLTKNEFMKKVFDKNEHVRNGDVEILGDYIKNQERIECYCKKHNVLWDPIAASLYKNIGCKECAKEGISEKNSMTHDEYVYGFRKRNSTSKVLTEYRGMYKDITIEFDCGHTWTTKAANAYYKDITCPYCSSQSILVGFNDLWTTDKETAMLLTNPDDGYFLMKYSGQKRSFTCPLCGKSQLKIVGNVSKRGLQCSFCSDGISYPNKFCRAFLDQLPIGDYKVEWQPQWAKPYLYDNFFEYNGISYILEADGRFHYSNKNEFGITLEERQKVDNIKNQLAREHEIILIRIDCRESDCEYIKNSILNSKLNNIFELDHINWKQCDIKAQNSFIKNACNLYMSGIKSTKEISQKLKVGINTINRYLQKGVKFGWCDYDPKKSHIGIENIKHRKPIIAKNIKTGTEYRFDSISICEKTMLDVCGITISRKSIYDSLKYERSCKGFVFIYINTNNTK